ncbi:hypothetical protein HELRODRAFT_91604 [Helobdella robusta]|uniref:Mitoguardin n=1 Tax=Helobdella robusta TaxID=6412 RepID=T1G859_HELRO|nr:hypothetical protein HELRODRAFT_91604 [Helobdella robusta]ESO11254.1 hypothetical protein HELRODRAFT_91604 [Helobdella robusta]
MPIIPYIIHSNTSKQTVDLSDLEEHIEQFQHLLLYEEALQQLQDGNVPHRILRTKQMGCTSDTEFLAKLHCIRQAFNEIFEVEENRKWFEDIGRELIGTLLKHADKDPSDFYKLYDNFMDYLKTSENWVNIEVELKGRNVKVMNFFDIVIDFLLFDGFDDLDQVPSTIVNICGNRWITNGFKETAILTFVWSVLKAKRTMLTNQDGFISHFYSISEITSPVFAWGFLGPDGPLKSVCKFFKDEVTSFMTEVFDFECVRFSTLTDLTEDIMKLARKHGQLARDKLSTHPSYWS